MRRRPSIASRCLRSIRRSFTFCCSTALISRISASVAPARTAPNDSASRQAPVLALAIHLLVVITPSPFLGPSPPRDWRVGWASDVKGAGARGSDAARGRPGRPPAAKILRALARLGRSRELSRETAREAGEAERDVIDVEGPVGADRGMEIERAIRQILVVDVREA